MSFGMITVESIAAGRDRVVSRFLAGKRGVFFVETAADAASLVTAEVDRQGNIVRILGSLMFPPDKRPELLAAVDHFERHTFE